jgi:hypothetical protein
MLVRLAVGEPCVQPSTGCTPYRLKHNDRVREDQAGWPPQSRMILSA